MAGLKFSRKEFEKSVKITDEIKHKISMFGTPFEGMNNGEVEIEVFPNRPDLLSLSGYLRALEAFLEKKGRTGIINYKTEKSKYKLIVEKTVPEEWPYAIACVIKGVKLNNERIKDLIQLQEKLGATLLRNRKKGGAGLYPLENIEFPIKFEGKNHKEIVFRPLEMNDYITADKVLLLHPSGRKYANICQNWKRMPVFTDKKGRVMSMPPIINSHDMGRVEEKTKDLFLEVTGNDFNVIKKVLVIIATTLAEMGGKIYEVECEQQDGKKTFEPNLEREKMKINTKMIKETIGITINDKEIKKLLERMGLDYEEKKKEVTIPAWRVDIIHECDIIEDIAIAYGYENIEPEMPQSSTSIGEESNKSKFCKKVSEILIGLGLQEVSTYHLLRGMDLKKTNTSSDLEVENSKTDYKYLRPSLIPGALRVLSENVDVDYPHKIFEIGTTFKKSEFSETGIGEKTKLCIASIPNNYTEAKQTLDYLMRMIGVKYEIEEGKKKELITGRTGKIIVNDKRVGVIGEVHPEILKNLRIKEATTITEVNMKELYKEMKKN